MSEEPPWERLAGIPKWAMGSLEETTTATGSRSDILRSLLYPIALLGGMIPVLVWRDAPFWILAGDAGLLVAFLALYAGVYVFCLFRRPDALRSERYHLAKIAIEQTLRGDNITGLRDTAPIKALPSAGADVIVNRGSGAADD